MDSPRQPEDEVQFHIIEDVEYMGGYCRGGYHATHIGDRFNDRYCVKHKLGHGSYSTVWLARDELLQRLVALKICIADASSQELEILLLLLKKEKSFSSGFRTPVVTGRDAFLSPLDTFHIRGPHGTHACHVFEFARCNLAEAADMSFYRPMQLQVARAIIAQFVLAVALMHHSGYVHGDLHLGNILLRHPKSLDHLSDEEIYEEFGAPEYEAVKTFDDKPIPQGVPATATVPLFCETKTDKLSLHDAKILLSDLGESYRPSEEQRLECRTPVHCRPPEDRFEPAQPRSFPSDIWTLACSIWGIIGFPLFESLMPCPDRTAMVQVEFLGKLPPEWWALWKERSEYFTEDGRILDTSRSAWDWDHHFKRDIQKWRRGLRMETMSLEEERALRVMLNSMLKYRPKERCSIDDVLNSEWMTNWAILDYEKLQKLQKESPAPMST